MVASPLVSICIPVYNRADIIANTIKCVVEQTYENLEILIVDNASTDNIEEVVSQFTDKRMQYIKNSKNLGQFGNFNRCIEVSNGDYIHILHSDDIIPPDFIRTCIEFLESHAHVMMTCTSAKIVTITSEQIKNFFNQNTIFNVPDGFNALLIENFVFCPSVICRKVVFDTVGTFSLDFPYAGDYYQWLRISKVYDIAYISDTYINYSIGEHSETHKLTAKSMQGYEEVLEIFIRITSECSEELQEFRTDLNQAFFTYIKNLQYARILKFIRKEPFDQKKNHQLQRIALSKIKPYNISEKIRFYTCYVSIFLPVIPLIRLLFRSIKRISYKDAAYPTLCLM